MIKTPKISIDSSISKVSPEISLGITIYNVQGITESSDLFKEKFNSFKKILINEYSKVGLAERDEIKAWRTFLKQLKIDPSRYKASAEALIKRTISDKPLFWVNAAVDINNFLSVLYTTPMGIYDLDNIQGNISYSIGDQEASYDGLNGRNVSMNGKPNLYDEIGSFGSPIVDSQRTKVTAKSKKLMHVIYFSPEIPERQKDLIIGKSIELFVNELNVKVINNKLVN